MRNHNDLIDTFGPDRTIEEIIHRLNELAFEGCYVFRGYEKQEQLIPGIIREEDNRDKEKELLSGFEKYGSNYFHATMPIDFMSYAQHFGIPTRLLDFTHNPFIALFFSLFNPKNKDSAYKTEKDRNYYYIRYASLKENYCVPYIDYTNTYSLIRRPIDSLAQKAWECIENVSSIYKETGNVSDLLIDINKRNNDSSPVTRIDDAILFVNPSQANQRIIMQQGLFMFPYTLDAEEHHRIIENKSDCITIHKSHRDKLLEYLETLGYNSFRLMPDLNNICAAIKRKYIEVKR